LEKDATRLTMRRPLAAGMRKIYAAASPAGLGDRGMRRARSAPIVFRAGGMREEMMKQKFGLSCQDLPANLEGLVID